MHETGTSLVSEPVGWTLFIGLWLAAGMGCLGKGTSAMRRARRVRAWPTTAGTLIHSELRRIQPDGEPPLWELQVRYRYRVANQDYQGSGIACGYEPSRSREEHQALLDKLQSARQIMVRYDPNHPGTAMLSSAPSRQARDYRRFSTSMIVMTCGIAGLVVHHGGTWAGGPPGPFDWICIAIVFLAFGAGLMTRRSCDSGRDDALMEGIMVL